mgnify:CR=1 FL=1
MRVRSNKDWVLPQESGREEVGASGGSAPSGKEPPWSLRDWLFHFVLPVMLMIMIVGLPLHALSHLGPLDEKGASSRSPHRALSRGDCLPRTARARKRSSGSCTSPGFRRCMWTWRCPWTRGYPKRVKIRPSGWWFSIGEVTASRSASRSPNSGEQRAMRAPMIGTGFRPFESTRIPRSRPRSCSTKARKRLWNASIDSR